MLKCDIGLWAKSCACISDGRTYQMRWWEKQSVKSILSISCLTTVCVGLNIFSLFSSHDLHVNAFDASRIKSSIRICVQWKIRLEDLLRRLLFTYMYIYSWFNQSHWTIRAIMLVVIERERFESMAWNHYIRT